VLDSAIEFDLSHDIDEPAVRLDDEIVPDPRSVPAPRRSALVAVAAAGLLIGGCLALLTDRHPESQIPVAETTSESATTTVPSPQSSAQVTATAAFRILRESDSAALGNMDTLAGPLIQSCMAAKGFTFTPNSTVLMAEQDQTAFLMQRYPQPRLQDGTWGYVFDSAGSTTQEPQAQSNAGEAAPGYFDALQGKTIVRSVVRDVDGKVVTWNQVGNGCYGQAIGKLFGSAQAYVTFFTQLNQLEVFAGDSWSALQTDPDYLVRNQVWAECMKSAGFSYQTISDPWNRDWSSPRPTPEEQHVAAADSQCRQGNHLDGADLLTLEERALGKILVTHPIGNYDEFERQAQALTAGQFPAGDSSTTSSTSATLG
jgi:hypothetical protein